MRNLVACTVGQSRNDKTHIRAQRLNPRSTIWKVWVSRLRGRYRPFLSHSFSRPPCLFPEHRAPARPFSGLSLWLSLIVLKYMDIQPGETAVIWSWPDFSFHGAGNHIFIFLTVHWRSYGTMDSGASHKIATGPSPGGIQGQYMVMGGEGAWRPLLL